PGRQDAGGEAVVAIDCHGPEDSLRHHPAGAAQGPGGQGRYYKCGSIVIDNRFLSAIYPMPQLHPMAKLNAWQTARIFSGPTTPTNCRSSARGTVWTPSTKMAEGNFSPSSTPTSTSVRAPRRVEVMGALVTWCSA